MGASFKDICETFFIHRQCHERFLPLKHPGCRPLTDLAINMSGLSDLRTGYKIARMNPDFHVLCYTLSGRGIAWDGKRWEALTRGTLLIVPARTVCGYRLGGARWRMLWFHMNETSMWRSLKPGAWRVRPSYLGERIAPLLEGVLSESQHSGPDAEAAVRHYAEIVSLYLRREMAPDVDLRARAVQHKLAEIWDQVNARLAHPWSVGELAARAHLSAVQFHRQCVRNSGRAPMRVVTRLRMERAEELLRNTAYPLKQIAALVGYENVFAFSTSFKRHAGRSPRAFRNSEH